MGKTNLVIPGHNPPRDTTIVMDIAVSPGPNTSTECTEDGSCYVNLNYWLSDRRQTYSHNELFIIRKDFSVYYSN